MTNSDTIARRVRELDGVRGIAALAVLVYHYTSRYDAVFGHSPCAPFRFDVGHHGVSLFFMISGFVILLTSDRTKSIPDFIFARFSRLYPVYWCAALLTFATVRTFGLPKRDVDFMSAVANLTMFQKFFGRPHIDGVYWTLSVELWFYGLMVLILLAGLRQHLLSILTLLVGIHVFDAQVPVFSAIPGWPAAGFGLRFLHLFLTGTVVYSMRAGWRRRYAVMLCVCVLAAIQAYSDWKEGAVVVFLMLALGTATLYGSALLGHRYLVFLGVISYSLYLVHQNIGFIVIRACYAAGMGNVVGILAAMLVSICLAVLLTFGVERPANDWLRSKYLSWRANGAGSKPAPAQSIP